MRVIEWVLGGGWLSTLLALVLREGMHKQEHKSITDDIEDLKKNVTENKDAQSEQNVVNATIMTQLGYITKQLDAIAKTVVKNVT